MMIIRNILLILWMLSLAACARAGTAEPAGDAADSAANDLPALDATYSGTNPVTGATLTVQYPATWQAQGAGATLQLTDASVGNASSPAESAVFVSIVPLQGAQLAQFGQAASPTDVLDALTTGEIQSELEAPQSLTVGGNPAARAQGGGENNDVLVYMIQFGDAAFVNITALTEAGALEEYAPLIAALVETITYGTGDAPPQG